MKTNIPFKHKPRIRWDGVMKEWQLYDGDDLIAFGCLPELVRLAVFRELTMVKY